MANKGNDKDMKAAIPAPRDHSDDLAMSNNSPTKTSPAKISHAQTASYASASARSQLPLQSDDSFQKTAFQEQLAHDNNGRGVEHSKPTPHASVDERQPDKPHQHTVAQQGMQNPAMAYSRTQEQEANNSHAQLSTDYPTREQLLEDLERTKFDLREREGHLNTLQAHYKTNLSRKDSKISSLQEQVQTIVARKDRELKDLTDTWRTDMIQKNREVDELRQMWKQTAKELGKYQAQEKVADQVTDPEVTQKARQIQYNVRNFAYQHFGGELSTGKSVQGSAQHLQKQLQTPTDFFEACMNSPMKRPMLVGAFLWDYLVKDVFERFMWCGTGVHHHMKNVTDKLKPAPSEESADGSEAKRRYQMWKANTSALLVDALERDPKKGQRLSRSIRDDIQDLYTHLAPLTKSKYEGITAQLTDIIGEALDLDQLLSKQVADIHWIMGAHGHEPGRFHEDIMELQQGEKRTIDGHKVQLVVAPGLIKRGRSTGEDYEMENLLLRMTVSCEPIIADKPPLPPRDSSKPGTMFRGFFNNTKESKTERAQSLH